MGKLFQGDILGAGEREGGHVSHVSNLALLPLSLFSIQRMKSWKVHFPDSLQHGSY